jgi:tRNA A-37 threonylcarbamoyl transferase component Bud32
MNGQPVTHPATEQLSAFGLGKLNEAAAAAIAQHLEGCLSCRKAVERVAGDTFVGLVRAAKAPASAAPSSPTPLPKDRNLNAPPAPPAPPADLPPELAQHAKYRIVRELGRGGMGVVYQAEHIQMERLVAIKVINKSILDHPQSLERFAREVKAAAKLSHPNIVAAYDFEQAGDLHMLVMEFVEGQNLTEIVVRKGPLPILNACHYVRQAALGLQHAYEKGMVHRDLKPQNLMLTPRGTVKLLDMGLARVASDKEGLTGTGATLGTPEYIAPEQAMDAAKADIRSDIYSLGCTLYCLLAGKPPFADGTAMQKILGHLEREPQPLLELRPEVPEKLAAVVARMMAKDPAQRYQKPVEVAQALAPFGKPGAKGVAAEPVVVAEPAAAVAARPATPTMAAGSSAVRWDTLTDGNAAGKVVSAKKQKAQKVRSRPTGLAAKKKLLIGGAAAGVALLTFIVLIGLVGLWAAGVFKVKTKDGTIVLENLPADADVLVDGGTVTVKGDDGKTFEVRVEPGKKHRLEVKKDGFKVFGEEVELDAGGRKSVVVRLEPNARPIPPDRATGVPVQRQGSDRLGSGERRP